MADIYVCSHGQTYPCSVCGGEDFAARFVKELNNENPTCYWCKHPDHGDKVCPVAHLAIGNHGLSGSYPCGCTQSTVITSSSWPFEIDASLENCLEAIRKRRAEVDRTAVQDMGLPDKDRPTWMDIDHLLQIIDRACVGPAAWVAEREETVLALRTVCEHHGDNDWTDDLHLADVVNKHLASHL